MAERTRRSFTSTISFFSFQDIIACVTGIMVIITLLLVVELVLRVPDATDAASVPVDLSALSATVDSTRRQRDELKKSLDEQRRLAADLLRGPTLSREQVEEAKSRVERMRESNKKLAAHAEELQKKAADLPQKIAAGEAELKRAQAESQEAKATLEKEVKKVRITVLEGARGDKKPLLVDCSESYVAVCELATDQQLDHCERFDGADPADGFLVWARRRAPNQEYFVLMLRPDGFGTYRRIAEGLLKSKFEIGTDIMPKDTPFYSAP